MSPSQVESGHAFEGNIGWGTPPFPLTPIKKYYHLSYHLSYQMVKRNSTLTIGPVGNIKGSVIESEHSIKIAYIISIVRSRYGGGVGGLNYLRFW